MSAVSVRDVTVAFEAVRVFDGLSLDIEQGEFIVLLGPSGCGKSTLLNAIAGLLDIAAGQIWIGGQERHLGGAEGPRHRHGFPVLRALPAHERAREHVLRPEDGEDAQARDRAAGRAGGGPPADHASPRPAARPALGRPAPARRDRPRARARRRRLPVRRAAVQPRREAAQRTARRDQAAARHASARRR